MTVDIQRKVRSIISEIEEKSADGDYIYRGEPKTHKKPPYYGKVSSSLWRELRLELEHFNIRLIEQEMLKTAKKHTGHPQQNLVADLPTVWGISRGKGLVSVDLASVGEKYPSETEFELLTEIQHYGGKTNLIDFTTDYLIALFFACDGRHDKDGRVILQEIEEIKDMINRPRNPQHRVIAQKSVFVHPAEGFIEPDEKYIVIISANLKQPLLEHLRKYHSVSTETIYNDTYGFIRNQSIHRNAYTEFYRGYACQQRGEEATASEKKQKWYEEAVKHHTQAIELNPNLAEAYHNRGAAHEQRSDYQSAIIDFDKAIELDSNYGYSYSARGYVHGRRGDYELAIKDCNRGIELDSKNSFTYSARGEVYYGMGDYERAIEDYTKAIDLNPDDAETYYNRGRAQLRLEEWEKAKSDLTTAKKKGANIVDVFRNECENITDFQRQTGITLPEDIADMLAPMHS